VLHARRSRYFLRTHVRLVLPRVLKAQHRHERLLRDGDGAELLHAFLARRLLLEQLLLAAHVAAVALGQHVLAQRRQGLRRDDLGAEWPLAEASVHV
jgi:hypothetical protein